MAVVAVEFVVFDEIEEDSLPLLFRTIREMMLSLHTEDYALFPARHNYSVVKGYSQILVC